MAETSPLASVFGNLYPYKDRFEVHSHIPEKGCNPEEIYNELQTIAEEEDKFWETGLISGTMYHGGKEHYAFLDRVFSLFSYVNLLQRDICPSGTKFESEIIAMVAKLLHGDVVKKYNPQDEVCGTITSGGTESIYNGVYIHREWAREEKGILEPEMVVPATIHPAFHKAAHYLGVKMISVPVDDKFEADVEAMRAKITPNTIALAGSAANYPYGVIDPLGKLSDLALEHKIGLHVDGCLGGFILPWVEKLGYDIPPFDFRLPGVTTMSCDTHKYGYALKGTSTLLVRNHKLLRYQFFSVGDWSGGLYVSPTVQGSRSGGLSAATWAAMVTMGEEGYLKAAKLIMDTADKIRLGIAGIPEIKIAGKSTFLISMISDQVDMYHVNDYLISKGWRMNGCQNPPGFHFCVTLRNTLPGVAEAFVKDLRDGVAYAKDPPQPFPKSGALYGLAGSVDGRAFLKQGMLDFIEATYGEV
jgi:glutamate/tyrosine decarboxylase-like PLP-dependent enzyme